MALLSLDRAEGGIAVEHHIGHYMAVGHWHTEVGHTEAEDRWYTEAEEAVR